MTFTRDQFPDFFAAVNDGRAPFAWQVRLLDHLLERRHWPSAIDAPTGSGKSSVIDVHVFAVALGALGRAPRLPRRLAVTVNRRAIVDQHMVRAQGLADRLDEASAGLVADVAAALRSLGSGSSLRALSMRGGLATDRSWVDDPVSCTVIGATPDMWGSRVLFRGYGTSRLARPREAGLLTLDTAVVIDEAHLNRQLDHTARTVAAIVAERRHELGEVPGLQVVSTTATPAQQASGEAVGVVRGDLEPGGALTDRLTSPKRLTYRQLDSHPAAAKGAKVTPAYASDVAEEVILAMPETVPEAAPFTVLCVLNTVDAAVRVHGELAARLGDECTALWVGRMRRLDLERRRAEHPGLFTVEGDPRIRVLVTTQTVEVGVDIDAIALVTELAPGSALAQRAGRVNRLGRRDESSVVVIGPASAPKTDLPPYVRDDLDAADHWLTTLGDGADMSPWALRTSPPPGSVQRRLHLSTLEVPRAAILSETTYGHMAEDDLSFWLRDSLERDAEGVGFVVRAPMPVDDVDALALVDAVPVEEDEVFPATASVAREVLGKILQHPSHGRALLVRHDGVVGALRAEGSTIRLHPHQAPEAEDLRSDYALRPGDVLVVDDEHAMTRSSVVVPPTLARDPAPQPTMGQALCIEVRPVDEDDAAEGGRWLLDVIDDEVHRDPSIEPEDLQERLQPRLSHELGDRGADAPRLVVPLVPGVPPGWAVVLPAQAVNADPVIRETWTVSPGPVSLDDHQTAVASRARHVGSSVGLPESIVEALQHAGAHHDDGKTDRRFQSMLGAPDVEVWAKSWRRSPRQVRRAAATSGLPRSWRHEQLSVARAAEGLHGHTRLDLIARLVGTSHGYGRPFFPHGARSLVDGEPTDATTDLFEAGAGWSDVLARTDEELGVWGCAYLEALLRAADCQVSKEGS